MTGAYTVSQINAYIRNLFAHDYALQNIRVRGEISNCKYHTSGHIYFTLKDAGAAMNCVMFARERQGLSFRLSDGQQVEARGQISVYERAGTYQLYVRELRLSGMGELYERFLALKEKLNETGMFDACYKKPLPPFAQRIGIVTAPTGAAIQDICNISKRMNPYVELILYPALVQGAGAKESIVRGIRRLDRMGLDVIIVGRGGGSIEDLWAFNEECVAQAIFEAQTPVISAVGHQTDVTIADFAADVRAETPSAAAELANFDYRAFEEELSGRRSELLREMYRKVGDARKRIDSLRMQLRYSSPQARLAEQKKQLADRRESMLRLLTRRAEHARIRLDGTHINLNNLMEARLKGARHRLELLAGRLHGLSPLLRLSGGYSYLTDGSGRALKSVSQLCCGDEVDGYLRDGSFRAEVREIKTKET